MILSQGVVLSKGLENRASSTFHFFLIFLLPLRHRGGPLGLDAHVFLSRERRARTRKRSRRDNRYEMCDMGSADLQPIPFADFVSILVPPALVKAHSWANLHGLPSLKSLEVNPCKSERAQKLGLTTFHGVSSLKFQV